MSGLDAVLARVATIQAQLGIQQKPATGFDEQLQNASSQLAASSSRVAVPTLGGTRQMWSVGPGSYPAVWSVPGDRQWRDQLPVAAQPFVDAVEAAAAAAGIDPRMLAAVAWAESGFVPDAVSHAGAIGLTQLMPPTAEALGVDPHDPAQNLAGGARYLREQFDRFGSFDLMLAAYNAGPGAVSRAGGIPAIPETQRYVPRVLDYFRQLGGQT